MTEDKDLLKTAIDKEMTISIRTKYAKYINGEKSYKLITDTYVFVVGRLTFYLTPEDDLRLSMLDPDWDVTFNPTYQKLTIAEYKALCGLTVGHKGNPGLLPFKSIYAIANGLERLRQGDEYFYLIKKVTLAILDNEIRILEDDYKHS